MKYQYVFFVMVALQVAGGVWFSYRGGLLNENQFYLFTVLIMIGQLGFIGEGCIANPKCWATIGGQSAFILITAGGGIQRYRRAKKRE